MRGGLNKERVVEAALALVAEAGARALTMRRLAARLGVQPTALYWHVDGRPALLDALVEHLAARLAPGDVSDGTPEARLEGVARRFRQTLLEHPHVLELLGREGRAARLVAPLRDVSLDVLLGSGLAPEEAVVRTRAFVYEVVGFVLVEQGVATFTASEHQDDGPRGRSGVPVRPEVAAAMAGEGDDEAFEFALRHLVRGLFVP